MKIKILLNFHGKYSVYYCLMTHLYIFLIRLNVVFEISVLKKWHETYNLDYKTTYLLKQLSFFQVFDAEDNFFAIIMQGYCAK